MKYCRVLILIAALLALLTVPAAAYEVPHANTYTESFLHTGFINNLPDEQAGMLKALGLFLGGSNGFELERSMTRAEAAVMLVRLLGAEAEAMEQANPHPFTDVPGWAGPYVGWLYANGLTRGMGGDLYGASQSVTAQQYAIFLARVLRGPDTPDEKWRTLLLDSEAAQTEEAGFVFYRYDAVGLTVRALEMPVTYLGDGTQPLLYRLWEQGVFTAEQLEEASFDVLLPIYETDEDGVLWRKVCGVPVAACPEPGLTALPESLTEPGRTWFFATRQEEDGLTVAQIDCRSMTVLASARLTDCASAAYMGSAGDEDLLLARSEGADSPSTETLLLWNGGEPKTYPAQADWTEHTELLDFVDGQVVAQRLEPDGRTTIFAMDAATGETIASYTVESLEWNEDGAPVHRTVARDAEYRGRYFGSAGMYRLGVGFHQYTDRPTLDVSDHRMGNERILTFTPGVTPLWNGQQAGDEILQTGDGWGIPKTTEVLLSAGSGHGIRILGFGSDFYGFQGVAPDGTAYWYALAGGVFAQQTVDDSLGEEERLAAFQAENARLKALGLQQ